MDLRRQRIENEWSCLRRMAEANPGLIVPKERSADEFLVFLRETSAPVERDGKIEIVDEHQVRFSFARFFPTIPLEAYLTRPVFHPNIHPATGFVCLWRNSSVADTVVEALIQLQRVLTCAVFTESSDHVMQPRALEWVLTSHPGMQLPLICTPLSRPAGWDEEHNFRSLPAGRRRRLS